MPSRPPSTGSIAAMLTSMSWTAVLGLAVLAAALFLNAPPASAQKGGYRLYPWCAYSGSGEQNCYYSTFEQCRESLGGHGMCTQNSWYAAYGPYYSFGRGGGRR